MLILQFRTWQNAVCFSNWCIVNILKVTNAVTVSCFCTATSLFCKAEWQANYMFGESVCWLLKPINIADCALIYWFHVQQIHDSIRSASLDIPCRAQQIHSTNCHILRFEKIAGFSSKFLLEALDFWLRQRLQPSVRKTPVAGNKAFRHVNPKTVEWNSVSAYSGGYLSHWWWGN